VRDSCKTCPSPPFPHGSPGHGECCAGPQLAGPAAELLRGSRHEDELVERLDVKKQDQKGAQKAENKANFLEKLQEANIFKPQRGCG